MSTTTLLDKDGLEYIIDYKNLYISYKEQVIPFRKAVVKRVGEDLIIFYLPDGEKDEKELVIPNGIDLIHLGDERWWNNLLETQKYIVANRLLKKYFYFRAKLPFIIDFNLDCEEINLNLLNQKWISYLDKKDLIDIVENMKALTLSIASNPLSGAFNASQKEQIVNNANKVISCFVNTYLPKYKTLI